MESKRLKEQKQQKKMIWPLILPLEILLSDSVVFIFLILVLLICVF